MYASGVCICLGQVLDANWFIISFIWSLKKGEGEEAPPHSLLATTKSFMKQMTCHCSETRCLLSCFVVNCVLVVQAHTQMISTGGSILFEKLYSIANLQIEVRYAPPTKRDIIHLWSVRLYLTFSLQWLQLIFGPDDPLSIELQATCRLS